MIVQTTDKQHRLSAVIKECIAEFKRIAQQKIKSIRGDQDTTLTSSLIDSKSLAAMKASIDLDHSETMNASIDYIDKLLTC